MREVPADKLVLAPAPDRFHSIVAKSQSLVSVAEDGEEAGEEAETPVDEGSIDMDAVTTRLGRKLSLRPDAVDLKQRNILKAESRDPSGLPSGSANSSNDSLHRPFNFEKRATVLKSILKKRPDRETLEGMHILKADGTLGNAKAGSVSQLEGQLQRGQIPSSFGELRHTRSLHFSQEIEEFETLGKVEYNRKPDVDATYRKLTPELKTQIREELNTYKKTEMSVHESSLRNTCFH